MPAAWKAGLREERLLSFPGGAFFEILDADVQSS